MKTSRLLAICLLTMTTSAWAWDGPAQSPAAGVAGLLHPSSYVDGSVERLFGDGSYWRPRLRANFVLFHTKTDSLQFNARAERFHLDENVDLVGTGATVPLNLWTVLGGLSFAHKMKNHDQWGVSVSGGSNSDMPFYGYHELDLRLLMTYHLNVDRLHSWLFLLQFSTARAFAPAIPLPGVGYLVINPKNKTVIFYGFPFFIAWSPTRDWSLHFMYFIPTLVNAEASYRIYAKAKVYLGFQWLPKTWVRAARSDYSHRVIFDQKQARLGLRLPVGKNAFMNAYGGYSFDQSFFEARSYFSKDIQRSYLPSGPLAGVELAYRL